MSGKGEGSWPPPSNAWENGLGHMHSGFYFEIWLCCSAEFPRPFWNRCWYEQVFLCSRQSRHLLMPASGPPDFNYYPGQQALSQLLVKDDCQQPALTTRPLKEEVLGRLALWGHRHQGHPAPLRVRRPGVRFRLQLKPSLSFPICKMGIPRSLPTKFLFCF